MEGGEFEFTGELGLKGGTECGMLSGDVVQHVGHGHGCGLGSGDHEGHALVDHHLLLVFE